MTFNEKYKKIKSIVQKELDIIEEKMISQIKTREPLNSALKDFLISPSKRIRPLLAILYVKALEDELSDEQLELLSAVELAHSASLIHDDIIDESTIRRGKQTFYSKFDNKLSVITGDYLLALVMGKLTKLNNLNLFDKFAYTIRQMCLGEINQNFDRFKEVSLEDYIEKTKNKTAYLFETTLVCCLMLGKNKPSLEEISEFGLNFGIAFQIRDDIINFTQTDTSKPNNNDVQSGIYNAPVLLGTEADNYLSGIEKTKVLLNNYVISAKTQVEKLPNNKFRTALFELLELLKDV